MLRRVVHQVVKRFLRLVHIGEKEGMEVTVGLEPTKASFAGWCLDPFGIATKSVVPKTYTQDRTQIAPLTPFQTPGKSLSFRTKSI